MPTRAVAYLRVSTDMQAEKGLSLDAQREKLDLYARLHELDVVEVIVDAGESGSTLERPGLQRALALLAAGEASAFVCVKLDRLTRSVRDLGTLLGTVFAPGRAELLSVSESLDTRTPAGRLVVHILGAVSQWERESTAQRTSEVMLHMSASGLFVGGTPPYGFRVGADGRLEPVEAEQVVITSAREMQASGLGFRAIAKGLATSGARSRTGRAFDSTQVRRMLQRASAPPSGHVPEPSADFRPAAEDNS